MAEDQEYEEAGDGDEESEHFVRMTRADIRKLEKSGAKASELEAKNLAMERKLAFLEAGVDLSTKVGQLMLKSWDGELDVETIQAEAKEMGALKGETAPTEVETDDGETESSDERASLGAGANADQFRQGDPDPKKEAKRLSREATAGGATEEDALGVAFDVLATAGAKGDKRVIWDPNE